MAPRVVLDTNCLISALIFSQGKMAEIRHLWQAGEILPLICRETATELIRVMAYPKFRLTQEEINHLLAEFLPWAETVHLEGLGKRIPELRDPDDAVFLHLARSAKALCLISGDRHLLELRSAIKDVRILSPGEYLEQRHQHG